MSETPSKRIATRIVDETLMRGKFVADDPTNQSTAEEATKILRFVLIDNVQEILSQELEVYPYVVDALGECLRVLKASNIAGRSMFACEAVLTGQRLLALARGGVRDHAADQLIAADNRKRGGE